MNKIFKYGALAVFVGAGAGVVAQADEATTTGGFKIKSADGNFDASLGGRIHFDALLNLPDTNSQKIGSAAAGDTNSDFEFRRVFVSLIGHVYKDFEYHIDYDIASSNFQDVWIAYADPIGGTVYAGQHKPWRSLDELASNNNTVFLERNIASATGVYGGIDYTEGVYYSINKSAFLDNDSVWGGVSVYSLHKQGGSQQVRTQGTGYNARFAYAPIVTKNAWAHVGVTYSNENADGAGSAVVGGGLTSTSGVFTGFAPAYSYGGRSGAKLTLASYATAATGNPHADIISAELAGAWGPAYFQGEYVDAGYHQNGAPDNSVDVFSVTGAYAITGETRPYDKKAATYGAIKPTHKYGALELAVRYDHGRNDKHGGSYVGLAESGITKGANAAGDLVTEDSVSLITVGVNYYVNSAVRFVLDYEHGEAKLGAAGKDSPDAVGLRAQLVF